MPQRWQDVSIWFGRGIRARGCGAAMFERVERDGVAIHTAPSIFEFAGIGIAFTERGGGVSRPPYASLNLAMHVGDDPRAVDANRDRLMGAIGIAPLRDRLTTAEQVHGTNVTEVTGTLIGHGAFAATGPAPVPASDVLWTQERGVPLLLLFADCVPVIVARPSHPAVAVVHAGRRGVEAGIITKAARILGSLPGPDDLVAFVGPHIGGCCYEVADEVARAFERRSHFDTSFVTITAASPRLDLGAVVADDLERSEVPKERQWPLGICTAHNTDRYYSYRAEGLTGRHGALAVIL